jgi:hypothetical protein
LEIILIETLSAGFWQIPGVGSALITRNGMNKNLHLPLGKSKIPPGEAGKAGGETVPI